MDARKVATFLVIAVAVRLTLKLLMANRGAPAAGQLGYSWAMKVFALVAGVVPVIAVAVFAAVRNRPFTHDDAVGFLILFALFGGLVGPLLLEFFRVQHRFDGESLAFASPWSRARTLRWGEVTALRWRSSAKWLELLDVRGSRFVFSPMLGGLGPFAEAALARIPQELLDRSPEALAVLQLMRRGAASGLLLSPASPAELLGGLPPAPGEPPLQR